MIAAVIPCAGEPLDVLRATLTSVAMRGLSLGAVVVVADGVELEQTDADRDGWFRGVEIVRLPERSGCPAAMNAGIRYAAERGATRIGRCDTGDEWRVDMRGVLRSDAPAAFGLSQWPLLDGWSSRLWYDNQFQASCTAFDVAAWQAVGGYDESLRFADDWDFALKVQAHCGWTFTGGVVAHVDASGISAVGDPAKEARRSRDTATVAKRAQALRRSRR